MSFDLKEKLKVIPPGWWSAVFGAAGAGALLAPDHRIRTGLLLGGAVLALACYVTPCCASCADAAPKPAPMPKPLEQPPMSPPIIASSSSTDVMSIFQTGEYFSKGACS